MTASTTGDRANNYFLCINNTFGPPLKFIKRHKCLAWIMKNNPKEICTVTTPLGDPRRAIDSSTYVGCVPPDSWSVIINPENTIRSYFKEEGVSFTESHEFLTYLRRESPEEYAAMTGARGKGEGEEAFKGVSLPPGHPRRIFEGFLIPASWSVMLIPRVGRIKEHAECSCEALGAGPLSKKDCFFYIKENQPEMLYTVPIPIGDPRRTVGYGGSAGRVSIPASFNVITAPITTGSLADTYFLCVSRSDSTLTFTKRQKCVAWIMKHRPKDLCTVALPHGDPRRLVNYGGGLVPAARWTVHIDPTNTVRCYETDGLNVAITNTQEFMKYLRRNRPTELSRMLEGAPGRERRKGSAGKLEGKSESGD
jgi:hypothetical protein